MIFPFLSKISVVPPWLWPVFILGVLTLLFLDLFVFAKRSQKISKKSALIQSSIWIGVALLFNLWFTLRFGRELGLTFLTGYLLEESLSVDNLFVILMIFSSFRISAAHQHQVLFYGVLGAIILRATFIILGIHLVNEFHSILYFFGFFLLYAAIKVLLNREDQLEVKDSFSLRLLKKVIPTTTKMDHDRFFVREKGVLKATPLFLAVVVVEGADLIFAVDSIPAVFSVTRDAFVAFGSNILAILGLRSLYFLLASWVGELRYLKPGLAAILAFVGFKMLLMDYIKVPNLVSLCVVGSILIGAALCSWLADSNQRRG